ncbi:unnamed protein product, partial [Amoebophrya sp. A120]
PRIPDAGENSATLQGLIRELEWKWWQRVALAKLDFDCEYRIELTKCFALGFLAPDTQLPSPGVDTDRLTKLGNLGVGPASSCYDFVK